ncbi:tripartite motif-containing protein 72 [Denticeps clupeoides]|uniref:tripartite motif-containing protein 72 n=1 Tax=Denticeps clupeoides TaxID=299321 RepID=UPI0010A31909|nr:tripartite motif-containing protein 72-like [Denticeps clupeoides]
MDLVENTFNCPICADVFIDPVLLPCGHNFCHTCINTVWNVDAMGSSAGPLFCPECQILLPSDTRPEINGDLGKKVQEFVEKSEDRLPLLAEPSSSSQGIMCDHCIHQAVEAVTSCLTCDASLCSAHTQVHQQKKALKGHTLIDATTNLVSYKCLEHSEELKLYCKDDQELVCPLCVIVGSHKSHQAVSLQEALSDVKKTLEDNRSVLLERRQIVERSLKDLEQLFSDISGCFEVCRDRVAHRYSQLRALIAKDEQLMLEVLESEELHCGQWLESQRESLQHYLRDTDYLTKTSDSVFQEGSHLKYLQYFRKQGISTAQLPEVQTESSFPIEKTATVERLVEELFQAVARTFPRIWSYLREVTLDPDTAHPKLEVSENKQKVHWIRQPLQDNRSTENPNSQYSVMAEESFSSGSHYWEVIVWDKPYWLIGLACSSKYKREDEESDTNRVFCYIYHGNGKYLACHGSEEIPVEVRKQIRKVGVWVDFQQGAVSFYNADSLALLHSFHVGLKEAVYPTLNPCIAFSGRNTHPLILFHPKNRGSRPEH